eukprot:UN04729
MKENVDKGIYIDGVIEEHVKNIKELLKHFHRGNKSRHEGETKMNKHSSRSHSVFTVVVESSSVREDGEEHIRVGKLRLVDLAGSERQKKTESTGERLMEATKINLSLPALGNVICPLTNKILLTFHIEIPH